MKNALFVLSVVWLLIFTLASYSRDASKQETDVLDNAAESEKAVRSPESKVIAVADSYINAWFAHFPEMATFYRIEDVTHDRLMDNTPEGRAAWESIEDQLLAELRDFDAELLRSTAAWLPYGILLENLEASRQVRICHQHSWDIDQVGGWQIFLGELATAQAVSTDEERARALVRWQQIPPFIDNEIQNLKDGLAAGFSAPQRNVSLVAEQVDDLLSMAYEDSPFFAPAETAGVEEFSKDLVQVLGRDIYPAMRRYRDFLVNEYYDQARTEISVAVLPNGEACYAALLRMFTTLPYKPEEMFAAGKEAIAIRESQITVVGEHVYQTRELSEIRARMRENKQKTFESRDEIIEYATAAVNRAREAAVDWFGQLPEANVIITPVPEYQERSSSARYVPASDDGALPGTYYINLFQPETQNRGSVESVAFHETYPGHHLQIALAQERSEAHPISRYIGNSGFIEGWARYSEILADEMDLYSSEHNTLSMLSGLPTGMVVDPGIHAMGWSRDEAIDYTLSKQVDMTPEEAGSYVDRIVVWPGQMVTYGAGELELIRLRRAAEAALGNEFDIREFHDQVLGNGSVTLIMLRQQIAKWLTSREQAAAN